MNVYGKNVISDSVALHGLHGMYGTSQYQDISVEPPALHGLHNQYGTNTITSLHGQNTYLSPEELHLANALRENCEW